MGPDPLVAIGDGQERIDIDAYREFLRLTDEGVPVALVTVVGVSGSTPRGMGAVMVVREDGSSVGTIGGGSLELLASRHAVSSLRDGKPRRLHYDAKNCSGVTDIFVQPSAGRPNLFIFGAGHIGASLAPMAAAAGFRVTVLDDRDGFPDPAKFPPGVRLLAGLFDEGIESLVFDESSTYVVIASYSHMKDEQILENCLRMPWKYIGMIGSRKKIETAFGKIGTDEEAGRLLSRVHAPIGLDLGGRSTGELAVSILAELLAVRNDREQVVPMKEKKKIERN